MTKFEPLKEDIEIGTRIRHFRKAVGMSQTALAVQCEVTFQQIQKYEKGTNRVSCSTLVLICKALGLMPMDILGPFFGSEPTVSPTAGIASEVIGLKAKLSEIRKLAA